MNNNNNNNNNEQLKKQKKDVRTTHLRKVKKKGEYFDDLPFLQRGGWGERDRG